MMTIEKISKTLNFMKSNIIATVWDNGDGTFNIVYDENEEFRPTWEQILAVDQELVNKKNWEENRKKAYEAKGWLNPYDIFDDIAKRGIEIVLQERLDIKNEFEKE